jgi:hypothetical protein
MDVKELKSELSKKGYATKTLWHMDDVQETLNQYNDANETNHRLTAWECHAIMEDIVRDDRVRDLIFELLDEAVTKRIE